MVLVETMPDGVLVADDDGRVLRVNASLARMLGYSRQELEARKVEDLLPAHFKKDHAAHRAHFSKTHGTRHMGMAQDLSLCARTGARFQ